MLVFINSATDRQPHESTSKWTTYFDNPIEVSNDSMIGISDIQIPYTCYQFTEGNSILWVATNSTTPEEETAYGLHIPFTRIYETVQDVVDELNKALQYYNLPLEFSVINSKIALKNTHASTSFRVISSEIYEPTFAGTLNSLGVLYSPGSRLFNEANQKLGYIGDLRNTNIPPSTTYIPAGLPRIIRTNCFYLQTQICEFRNVVANVNKNPNILAKIPLTGNFGTLINLNVENPVYVKIADNSIDFIYCKILDEDYNEVDLNGAPVTITFEIK